MEFKQYRKKHLQELRPYVVGEDVGGVSISPTEIANGSPKEGDMIARNAANHADQWLVSAQFFADNYEAVE